MFDHTIICPNICNKFGNAEKVFIDISKKGIEFLPTLFPNFNQLFIRGFPDKYFLTLCLLAVTCCLLITFANRLDPDQDRQNVGPDLDPNGLTL